ncbi:hypothetical protein [Kineosporia sp. NBRC 101677]|uniref:hypothetical protein n=1 Tax=Kineosporia sp. NBRC 101677 TaxID=3032197 RepID=UPI0025576EC1|nr:hypothetical protein [Kineosporia sp. NBRC 101677]
MANLTYGIDMWKWKRKVLIPMDDLDAIPVTWWLIEGTAQALIESSSLGLARATFEFRVIRDVLSLTMAFDPLARIEWPPQAFANRSRNRLAHRLEAANADWAWWVAEAFRDEQVDPVLEPADLLHAQRAWQWLLGGRLLLRSDGFAWTPLSRSGNTWKALDMGVRSARHAVAALNS